MAVEIWEALYCSCIYESADMTLSIHKTKLGARKAMIQHRLKKRKKYQEHWRWLQKEHGDKAIYEFGVYEDWSISETELLE